MVNNIPQKRRKEVEHQIKLNYTKHKILSNHPPIKSEENLNFHRFIPLAENCIKRSNAPEMKIFYHNLMVQATIFIDYNKRIQSKIDSGDRSIDMKLLLSIESQIIKDQLKARIDSVIKAKKAKSKDDDNQIVIIHSNIDVQDRKYKKSSNLVEYISNPTINDIRNLYKYSRVDCNINIEHLLPFEECRECYKQ